MIVFGKPRMIGNLIEPPPQEIIDLKWRIETETKVAEIKASTTGVIDQSAVEEIVRMKRELDRLYILWLEGKIA